MRKWLALLLLAVALFPSVWGVTEAWEHHDHSHASACQEEGAHMHPFEAHCELDAYAFFGYPWDLGVAVSSPEDWPTQSYQQPYRVTYFDAILGNSGARGPPRKRMSVPV